MMDIYTMKVPDTLEQKVIEGTAKVVGSIIKDVNSGKIIGHLEQMGGKAIIKKVGLNLGKNIINGSANPFGTASSILTNIQNQKIINDIKHVQKDVTNIINKVNTLSYKVDNLANLAWINSGIGILNLGASCAGTAILSHKINKLEQSLKKDFLEINSKLDIMKKEVHESNILLTDGFLEECKNNIYLLGLYTSELSNHDLEYNNLRLNVLSLLNEINNRLDRLISYYMNPAFNKLNLPNIIIPMYISYMALLKIFISKLYMENHEIFPLNERHLDSFYRLSKTKMMEKFIYSELQNSQKLFLNSEVKCLMGLYTNIICEPVRLIESQNYIYNNVPYEKLKEIESKLVDFDDDVALIEYR